MREATYYGPPNMEWRKNLGRFRMIVLIGGFARIVACLAFFAVAAPAYGQADDGDAPETGKNAEAEYTGPMTPERLNGLILRIDENAQRQGNTWQLQVEGMPVTVIIDTNADRMRIVTAVIEVDKLTNESMARLLQANFDSALDARYAIARNILWGTFIHPLSSLDDAEFLSGLGQVVNLVFTFGTTYSSGLFFFGGGDSNDIMRRELIDRLLKDGQPT